MALKIENYSFGKMTIGRKEFTTDLIIHSDGQIKDNWWRNEGHKLVQDDLSDVLDSAPEYLIIGTGAFGMMKVSGPLLAHCKETGIEVVIKRTPAAVKIFNNAFKQDEKVAACFHLTC